MEDTIFWIMDKLIIWVIAPILIVILAGAVLMIPFGIYSIIKGESNCVRQEKQLVHHNGYNQYIFSGKVMIPIYHSAYESMDWVCIESKEDKK